MLANIFYCDLESVPERGANIWKLTEEKRCTLRSGAL